MKENKEKITDRRQISPLYSKKCIDKAAKRVIESLNRKETPNVDDEKIIENWRASHTHIINTWQIILKNKNHYNAVFVQRLKRKNTIYDKLKRFPQMSLARMHDIAGCRLIFNNEQDLHEYRNELHKSRFNHRLKTSECKDYISFPKQSGYRGLHDVYIYESKKGLDRSKKWNGLLLEIQYRTKFQHAWATAVEVADTLMSERAKFSEGSEKQQEFFRLASEIISRAYENKYSCKKELDNMQLLDQFQKLEHEIGLLAKLKKMEKHSSGKTLDEKNIIIHLKKESNNTINIDFQVFSELSLANKKYFELEKKYPNDDIVLVRSTDKTTTKTIKDAYRNYFADTDRFTQYIENGIRKLSKKSK